MAYQRIVRTAVGAALRVVGCGPHIERLYPHPETARGADEVASISGPIAFIDEKPVSARGTVFHVLPGCHVVRLMDRIGEMNAEGTQGYSAHLPQLVYAFRTTAGHAYGIEIDARGGSGLYGQLSIHAFERAPDGASSPIQPTGSASEIQDCLTNPAGEPGRV